MSTVQISKFLSLVLRHKPAEIGITLDEAGWVDVDDLLDGLKKHGQAITFPKLEEVVDTNDKQRFEFNEDATRIRARQGHTVAVTLGYEPQPPPAFLYHSTVAASIPLIQKNGLQKMRRHAVHLSPDRETATRVGQRRGMPLLLKIRAQAMHEAGHLFYCTANNVWLTELVPAEFIEFPV